MRPIEWLLNLVSENDGYARLIEDSGGLAPAAWKLAEARCRSRETSTHIPSRIEVRAAARDLAMKLGLGDVPKSMILKHDCESRGLPVI